jgi:predicted RNA-binding Zn ribbon-like protein
MRRASPSRSVIPGEPFRFVGGHVAADLVNTVNWEELGPDRDRLSDYGRVVAWAAEAGVIDGERGAALRAAAAARPVEADTAYEAVRWTRDVLRRVLWAVGHGTLRDREGERALADLNALLANVFRAQRLAPATGTEGEPGAALAWRWEGAASRLDALLWPVVWACAQLLAGPDAARVRVCGGAGCGWVYVDRSRNGLRRWCEMQTCGTLEKSRRRARRAAGSSVGSSID